MDGVVLICDPARQARVPEGMQRHGSFYARAVGRLASTAVAGELAVFFEGALLGSHESGRDDADVALERFRDKGVEGLRALDGFYRIVAIDIAEDLAWLISDELATRPSYIYKGHLLTVCAPSPMLFHDLRLPMTLDRGSLYQMLRMCHPVGARTLIREVSRTEPRSYCEVDADGTVTCQRDAALEKSPDPSVTLDDAADTAHGIVADVVSQVLAHDRLRDLPVHLPLTAGMDSRHLLGVLLDQDRPPLLRHIRFSDREYTPVDSMATDLGLPLTAPYLHELDLASLTRRWLESTGGLVHFHQAYLLGVGENLPRRGALGFDGYLSGFYLGFNEIPRSLDKRNLSPTSLKLLFGDHKQLEDVCIADLTDQRQRWSGAEHWCQEGVRSFNRGPSYTGGMFPVVGPGAYYFAPGAHRRALSFFCNTPDGVARYKRARVRLLQKHFPKLAAYPNEYGENYAEVSELRKHSTDLREVTEFVWGMLPINKADPAPKTAHEWVRKIPFYRRLVEKLVNDSALARDQHIPKRVLRGLWTYEKMGGFVAWTLLGLVSAEAAYRLMVLGESSSDVADWLTQ